MNDADKISCETVNFFRIIQELYNYFLASVKLWAILKKHICGLNLKSLSTTTRWESRVEAIRPLKYYIKEIYHALFEITKDETKDIDSRVQADNLISKICSFQFICSILVWYEILNLVNVASKMMQNPTHDITKIIENLDSIIQQQNMC